MAVQDQSGVARSQGVLSVGNGLSFISGSHSISHSQLNDQFSSGNDYAPKVRKPYTITKQRERWTDEEHNKFLEALKLYGRAWRRIEEHVGTKTAVQIRSHAQKFFSKVVRDSGGNNTCLVEPIEIPPPRPKRKPMHPYPRKLIEIPNKEISARSNSHKSLDFDQDNKSPKSVLSAVVSETLASSDSDTPTGSLSPVSSTSGLDIHSFALAEPKTPFEEERSPQTSGLNAGSANDEHPIVKFEPFHKESASIEDDAAEESSGRTLKLFGTTVLIDTLRKSSPTMEVCKPVPALHLSLHLSHSRLFVPLLNEPEGKYLDSSILDEFESKEVQKEGSWTGSNTSSVSDGENNEKPDDQAKSSHVRCYRLGHTTQNETSTISEPSIRPKTCGKGFVPYKRCMADRENHCYSPVIGEKREEQRIRLSL